jgi:hypothetical protein
MQPTRIDLLEGMPIFGAIREESLRFLLELAGLTEVREGEFFSARTNPAVRCS